MAVVGLVHINLTCPAALETAVLAFYGDQLGLPRLAKPTDRRSAGGWFDLGGPALHVSIDAVSVAEQRANPRHIALIVDDLTTLRRKLKDAGAELLDDPRPAENERRCFVVDPAGNRLELIGRDPP